MYLLDTETIIYTLKGNDVVISNIKRHLEEPMKMSIVTLMELYYGAYKSGKVASSLAKAKRLESAFEIISAGGRICADFWHAESLPGKIRHPSGRF